MAESPFVLIQWGLERCRWSASAEDEFRVLQSFKMSSRCWEIKVIATRRVRKINKDQVIKIGSNFRVKWILWFWHDGGNDLHGFRYEMYFSIWKNWYFWSPRSHHHFIAFDIQYFLFCKKKYCKILGWLIYALYEKEIILVHLGFYRLRMDESELDLERVKGEPFLLAFPFCRRQIISWMCWATSSTATEKSKVIKYTKIHLLGEFFVKLNLVNLTMFITNLHCQHHEVL